MLLPAERWWRRRRGARTTSSQVEPSEFGGRNVANRSTRWQGIRPKVSSTKFLFQIPCFISICVGVCTIFTRQSTSESAADVVNRQDDMAGFYGTRSTVDYLSND